jgi:K+ transporter
MQDIERSLIKEKMKTKTLKDKIKENHIMLEKVMEKLEELNEANDMENADSRNIFLTNLENWMNTLIQIIENEVKMLKLNDNR